jgi:hypothetical protein
MQNGLIWVQQQFNRVNITDIGAILLRISTEILKRSESENYAG